VAGLWLANDVITDGLGYIGRGWGRRHRRDRKGKTLPLINADDTDREWDETHAKLG
jgi:hypothetical protein